MGYEIDILLNIQRSANNYLGINKSFSLSENNINISIQRNSDKYLKINRNDDSFLNFIQQATQQATQQYPSVQNLSVNSIGDGFVVLQWDSAANAIGYNVYVNSVKYNGTPLSISQSSYYTIQNLVNGTQYSIYVTALYTGNNESSPSNTILVAPNKVQAWYDNISPGFYQNIYDLPSAYKSTGGFFNEADGLIYVFSPVKGAGPSYDGHLHTYDPVTGVWADKGALFTSGPNVTKQNYVYNGQIILTNSYGNDEAIKTVDLATLAVNVVYTDHRLDNGYSAYDAANSVVILFDGQYGSGYVSTYDMTTDTYTLLSQAPNGATYGGRAVYNSDNGLVYFCDNSGSGITFYSYDYLKDQWVILTAPSVEVDYLWIAYGYIYMVGNDGSIYRYNISLDSWELVLTGASVVKFRCINTIIGGALWEIGGQVVASGGSTSQVQIAKFTSNLGNIKAPIGLHAIYETNTSIKVGWIREAANVLSGYNIYVNGVKNNTTVYTGNEYIISNLTKNQSYTIEVRAVDTSNNESLGSQITAVAVASNMYSMKFSGSSYVDFGNVINIKNVSQTWMCWYKATSNSSYTRLIDKRGTGGTSGVGYPGMQLSLNGSDFSNTLIQDSNGNYIQFNTGAIPQASIDGNWHHVALVWDNATGTLSFYHDFVFITSKTDATMIGADCTTTRSLFFGEANTLAQSFVGNIDEVQIWGSALSLSDIQNYGQKILVGDETGLLLYIRFDDLRADATDLSMNKYNGVISGGVYDKTAPTGLS